MKIRHDIQERSEAIVITPETDEDHEIIKRCFGVEPVRDSVESLANIRVVFYGKKVAYAFIQADPTGSSNAAKRKQIVDLLREKQNQQNHIDNLDDAILDILKYIYI